MRILLGFYFSSYDLFIYEKSRTFANKLFNANYTTRMRKLLILLGIAVCLMSATPVVTDQKRVLWEDIDTIYMLAGKGRYDSAMTMANNLLPVAIEHHQRQVVVLLLNTIGTGYRYLDMDEQALKVFKLAEDCINELTPEELQQLEETPHIINIYINLAEVCKDLKKKDESLRYASIAASKTEKNKDSYVRGMVLPLVGGILLEYGKAKDAEHYLKLGYQNALASHFPGNALIAASHMMTIEAGDNNILLKDSRWKKKADQLLPQVKDEYPRGIYYTALSHLHLAAGELKESKDAIDEAMKLESVKNQMTPERSKKMLQNIENEKRLEYTAPQRLRIQIISTILILVLFLFATYIIYQSYRRKKQAEKAELQMAEQYIEGLEHERSRMAKELHDGVSNQLLAVEMKLNADGLTEQAKQLLRDSREQIRQVSHTMMPPEFSRDSLDIVLAHYIDNINGAQGCEITFFASPTEAQWDDIPQETALEIYRIVQEAISNALKHASPTLIAAGIKRKGKRIIVTISNDGTPPPQFTSREGIGSRTIQERAKSVGAILTPVITPFATTLMVEFDLK